MSGHGRSSGSRESRIDLGKLSIVRLSTHGKKLELIVDPEKAWLYRQGEDIPMEEIIEGYTIFENLSKGLKVDTDFLEVAFGTTDEKKAAELLLKRGELLLTQEQRKNFLKEKRDEIIEFLVTRGVNPRTKAPHPASRIEKAMDEAGVRIDRKEAASDQAMKIIDAIQSILPITIETATIEFIIPATLSGKMYGQIKGYGDTIKENWNSNGSLTLISKTPAGIVAQILEEVKDHSKGKIQATVIDRG